jgi:predicted nucleic acid-binding protein
MRSATAAAPLTKDPPVERPSDPDDSSVLAMTRTRNADYLESCDQWNLVSVHRPARTRFIGIREFEAFSGVDRPSTMGPDLPCR